MGTPATKPAQLHPGRHGLDRAFVIQNQRDRILNAIAEEVARKGYVETTVADVVSRAGVSSRTFYDFFRDKAECFLAAYDAAIETLLRHVSAVYERMPEPTPQRARAVLGAVLDVFAAEPAFARMCMVEVSAAGPEALKRYVAVVDGFLSLLDPIEDYPAAKRHRGRSPDPIMRQALVGGIAWVIYKHIVSGQTERLPELLPQLTYHLLEPFLGQRQAADIAFSEPAGPRRPRARGDDRAPRARTAGA